MTPHHLTGADYAPKPVVDDSFLDRCLVSSSPGPRLILVGDSFANRSVPHLAVVAERLARDLGVLFGYGCPFPLRLEQVVHAARTVCHEVDDAWLRDEIVERLRAGDILVVRLHLSNPEYLDYSETTPTAPVSYDDEIEALALDVRSKGARLVVIGDNPRLSVRDLQLLTPQWFNFGNAKDRVDANNTPETAYFHALDRHLQDRFSGSELLEYFSVAPYFCDDSADCRTRLGEQVYYRDRHHLTPAAYDLFVENLATLLMQIDRRLR
jgi:hypothetical protein